jgi:Xaa-Pro aminopeptidase
MAERGYDAAILRNNPDLRWLTGAERTFDDEIAHTAFVTADGLWLHTDSRYFGTFQNRLGADTPWKLDMDIVSPAWWAAQRIRETRSRVVAVEDTCDLAFFDALGEECAKASVAALTPRLHGDIAALRIVKDAEEVELMRHAQSITDAAFEHICGYIKPGLTEQQVRAELEGWMLSNGADSLSFDSIIASGPNGANPHAQPGERVIQRGDMIVMDYGAGYHDYHSDMTRTVCVGEPSDLQRKVYEATRAANEACEAAYPRGCHWARDPRACAQGHLRGGLPGVLLRARAWPRCWSRDSRAANVQHEKRQAHPCGLCDYRRAGHVPARAVRRAR